MQADELRLIQSLYAHFERGRSASILTALTEDVEWQLQVPIARVRVLRFRGRQQVARLLLFLARRLEIEAISPQAYVTQPDTVIVAGHARVRIRSTGRILEFDWLHRWAIRQGRVARFVGSAAPRSAPH
jgi:ketosteroid isomerase-like protein